MPRTVKVGLNDLATTNPELVSEWDYEKNHPLTPEKVSFGSERSVAWVCQEGHEYRAIVISRTRGKSGCPVCSGQKVVAGFNDLATTNPELVSEWDDEKNHPLTPQAISAGSGKKVWWKCKEPHSFEMTVQNKVRGSGCSYCSGQKVLAGFNDLATTNPELMSEWDYEKNHPLTPQTITSGSPKTVAWVCPYSHSYKAPIASRARRGSGCAVCSGQKVLAGFNDLATTNPELVSEWDDEKNHPLTPQAISAGSRKKVWWRCETAHSYQATVASRSFARTGCPFCSGRLVITGKNDLETANPELASEWDFQKNHPLTPSDVLPHTNKRFWWKCSEGHSWQTTPNHRMSKRGCPACAPQGYDATRQGLLYFIANKKLFARKVGITNPDRNDTRLSKFGEEWRVICVFEHEDGGVVRQVEAGFFRWLRKELGVPAYLGKEEMGSAGGQSETFEWDYPSNEEVIKKLKALFSSHQAPN